MKATPGTCPHTDGPGGCCGDRPPPPPRTGKILRSQDALKAEQGPGREGREVTENKAPATELEQKTVGRRIAAP